MEESTIAYRIHTQTIQITHNYQIYQTFQKMKNILEKSSNSLNIQQDLGLNIKLDTLGSSIDIKSGYNYYSNNQNQLYSYNFLTPDPYLIDGNGDNIQSRHFAVLQADLTKHFNHKIIFEAGLKLLTKLIPANLIM